jgi:hypothetical protein
MQHTVNGASGTRLGWTRVRPSTGHAIRTLYYLAILFGLLLLYGGGDVSTTGFIYQAF